MDTVRSRRIDEGVAVAEALSLIPEAWYRGSARSSARPGLQPWPSP